MLHLKTLRLPLGLVFLPSWLLASGAMAEAVLPSQFSQTLDTGQREVVRQFYNVAYTASNAINPEWSGAVSSCDPGSVSDAYQQATLRRINWFRAMSGVPAEVALDPDTSSKAQQAALMMTANQSLTHYPPAHWDCYTEEGNAAAASSTLSLGNAGPDAVTGQFRDHGSNNTGVGHRRWLAFPITPSMGIGSVVPTSGGYWRSGIIWVMNYLNLPQWWNVQVPVRDTFVAWPSPGYVPYQVVYPRWSFSYKNADFSKASVEMLENGQPLDVQPEPLDNGAGLNTLVWIPAPYKDGDTWAHDGTDRVYNVRVNNVLIDGESQHFEYAVTVIDPDVSLNEVYQQALEITGPDRLAVNKAENLTATGLDFADEYQWRLIELQTFEQLFDGDPTLEGLEVNQSSGYSVITSERVFSGENAYHLAHPQAVDQSITLGAELAPGATSRLNFYTYLGYATEQQSAVVELSQNDGQSWQELWRQAGSGAPAESDYAFVSIDLADYANQTVKIRFRYAFAGGSFYPQTHSQVGWFFDTIHLQQVDEVQGVAASYTTGLPTLNLQPTDVGRYGVQLQPLLFGGFPAEWGSLKRVKFEPAEPVSEPKKRRGMPVWLYINQ